MAPNGPRVLTLAWGQVDTEVGPFRDAKLWPGGGRAWDWNETGTHHEPGVQPADVAEILAAGPAVIIIGCGQQQRLKVPTTTVDAIRAAGAECEVYESGAAVARYNALIEQGTPTGALIHSTC